MPWLDLNRFFPADNAGFFRYRGLAGPKGPVFGLPYQLSMWDWMAVTGKLNLGPVQ